LVCEARGPDWVGGGRTDPWVLTRRLPWAPVRRVAGDAETLQEAKQGPRFR
jgi:hypothetical protein